MKTGSRILIISGIVLLVCIVTAVVYGIVYVSGFEDRINNLTIDEVDLSAIPDATYKGEYNAFPVVVELEVTVSGHAITDIALLKHLNGQGQPAEAILESVIHDQSTQVDFITGATASSKVILKAIEDALTIE